MVTIMFLLVYILILAVAVALALAVAVALALCGVVWCGVWYFSIFRLWQSHIFQPQLAMQRFIYCVHICDTQTYYSGIKCE